MVASHCLCWTITATVLATVIGRTFRQLPDGRIASAPGHMPISTAADDGGNSNHLSMLDTGSDSDKSGQSASTGVEHPLSWLFDGWSHAAVPGPVASPLSAASFTPATAGNMSTTVLPPATDREAALPPVTEKQPCGKAPTAVPTAAMAAAPPTWDGLLPVPTDEVSRMRNEITELRQEVVNGNKDMWNAVRLISSTVEKDNRAMQAVTQDVQMLRGRHGGSVPLVATECSMRQSSCSECLSVPSCVWCKVEQRCYSGDSAGPVHGECAFFKHGTCG